MIGIEIVNFCRGKLLINVGRASLWDKAELGPICTETYVGKF